MYKIFKILKEMTSIFFIPQHMIMCYHFHKEKTVQFYMHFNLFLVKKKIKFANLINK